MSQGPATGSLVKGIVSDAAPDSTVDGTIQALSLSQRGRLRVLTDTEDPLPLFVEEQPSWGCRNTLFNVVSPWENW